MKKLSPAQQRVLALMAEGWELGVSCGLESFAWLQQGGIGKGGPSENVRLNTVHALLDRKLIRAKRREFPSQRYELVKVPDAID